MNRWVLSEITRLMRAESVLHASQQPMLSHRAIAVLHTTGHWCNAEQVGNTRHAKILRIKTLIGKINLSHAGNVDIVLDTHGPSWWAICSNFWTQSTEKSRRWNNNWHTLSIASTKVKLNISKQTTSFLFKIQIRDIVNFSLHSKLEAFHQRRFQSILSKYITVKSMSGWGDAHGCLMCKIGQIRQISNHTWR